MRTEDERLEFKSVVTDDLYKEVVAFINTDGGVIEVGVDDDGRVIGLREPDKAYTQITNGIRDAIMPDATMFIRYQKLENGAVRVTVSEGANKPYYLKGKGLKPSGVYIRQGASSVPASPEAIRQMIKTSDGDVFEELRSLEQTLTFHAAAEAFKQYGVPFSEEKYLALGMLRPDEPLYTNLALLLSDQCAHTVKIAVFDDDTNTVFKDQKEFGGSVFAQLNAAFQYLMLCNRRAAVISGLTREEHPDYPEEAIREALLNAIVHRDYAFSGSIIINVNAREMEFISLGGLLPGLSPEDIRAGISQPRNRNLAAVFHRLRLIESYGTGIRRIFALYADCPVQPRIEVTPNTFRMILPNRNAAPEEKPDKAKPTVSVTPQMRQVLALLDQRGQMSEPELRDALGLKKTRTYTLMKQMLAMQLVTADGRGTSRKYRNNPHSVEIPHG